MVMADSWREASASQISCDRNPEVSKVEGAAMRFRVLDMAGHELRVGARGRPDQANTAELEEITTRKTVRHGKILHQIEGGVIQ